MSLRRVLFVTAIIVLAVVVSFVGIYLYQQYDTSMPSQSGAAEASMVEEVPPELLQARRDATTFPVTAEYLERAFGMDSMTAESIAALPVNEQKRALDNALSPNVKKSRNSNSENGNSTNGNSANGNSR